MDVEPDQYRTRVLAHLKKNRPQQVAQEKQAGTLDRTVNDLCDQIADWVNSQLPSEASLENLGFLEKIEAQTSALAFAESDAMRELLPRDEASDGLIGPNGGYVDRLVDEEDDY